MGVVRIVQRGNLCLPFLLIWGAAFSSAELRVSVLLKEVEQVSWKVLMYIVLKNPGSFDLVSGFASDLLNLFTLNNLCIFFSLLLRFWPSHWNEGLLMCNSVLWLNVVHFVQPACKWSFKLQMLLRLYNLIIMSLYNYKEKKAFCIA